VVYEYNGILLGCKKERNLAICNDVDGSRKFCVFFLELESIMLSEISESEKDKNHMISLICGI